MTGARQILCHLQKKGRAVEATTPTLERLPQHSHIQSGMLSSGWETIRWVETWSEGWAPRAVVLQLLTWRPVTRGILGPSILGPGPFNVSINDLEKARECTLIKLAGNTGLGTASSYAWEQGCHPEGPGTHCDSARTSTGCCSREGPALAMPQAGTQGQGAALRRTARGSWQAARRAPASGVLYLLAFLILQRFMLSTHCLWSIWLWNLNNIISAVLLENKVALVESMTPAHPCPVGTASCEFFVSEMCTLVFRESQCRAFSKITENCDSCVYN